MNARAYLHAPTHAVLRARWSLAVSQSCDVRSIANPLHWPVTSISAHDQAQRESDRMTGALTCTYCFCVLDTRYWLTVCLTVVYDCRCGFSSGTAVGFQRHIARYKGEFFENMHLVPSWWTLHLVVTSFNCVYRRNREAPNGETSFCSNNIER